MAPFVNAAQYTVPAKVAAENDAATAKVLRDLAVMATVRTGAAGSWVGATK